MSKLELQKQFERNGFLKTLFKAIPFRVMIIDNNFKIQTINEYWENFIDTSGSTVIDKSIGEVLRCITVDRDHGTCGHSEQCKHCQIYNAAQQIMKGHKIHRVRTKISLKVGDDFDDRVMLITAAPIEYDNTKYALILMEDITELSRLRLQVRTKEGHFGFIGRDPKMLELFETIEELAHVDVPVMIEGESGTGKELTARAIHDQGPRSHKPFIAVNCGAIPETLLESELFGHVKGAFTGAIRDKKGRFELADGGTIFLDEISDISPLMQVKLLRVLQEGTFERVGSETTTKVNVRLISATNKDIQKEIAANRFREDLYYRLCVVPLKVPPLRERREDVALLAEHFLSEAQKKMDNHSGAAVLSYEAVSALQDYHWPGNIRELQNAIHFALVKCKSQLIETRHLPPNIRDNYNSETSAPKRHRKRKLDTKSVREALNKSNGNKVKTAELLGVSRATLYRFLDEVGI
ncbi:AAA domain-containing protein [candidate division KSB1 bacterium]|nr:AAA domain-containing protein [candidate division KSB1 bacterium]